ncbi:MAG: hypothetical protein ABSF00_04170 [Candidatus Bathyarchaeia archaeon]
MSDIPAAGTITSWREKAEKCGAIAGLHKEHICGREKGHAGLHQCENPVCPFEW